MTLRTRLCLALWSAALAACGSRTSLDLYEHPPDAAAVVPGTCPALLPPPPTEIPVFGERCEFTAGSPPRIVLASIVNDRLVGVGGDGAVTELYRFGRNAPFPSWRVGSRAIVSRGGYLFAAVTLTRTTAHLPDTVAVETVLLSENNPATLLRQVSLPVTTTGSDQLTLAATASGVFAWSVKLSAHAHTELLRADGFVYPARDGVQLASADPLPDGTTLVIGEDSARGSGDLHWMNPCTGALRPAAVRDVQTSSMLLHGTELLYADPTQPTFVRERGDGVQRLPMAGFASPAVFADNPGSSWVMVGRNGDPEVALFDASREARRFTITAPPGTRLFRPDARFEPAGISSAHGGFGVNSRGEVTLAFRDDALGRLYASDNGVEWSPIGQPVGRVYRLSATERAGTYVITTEGLGFTRDDWAPAPPGSNRVDGASVQVVNRSRGFSRVVPIHSIERPLSHEGGCLAWWSDPGHATVLALRTGALRVFDLTLGQPVVQFGGALVWGGDTP